MYTSELVAAVQQDSPDTQVPTILTYINEIQRQMLSKPTASARITDPLTGEDPKITFDGAIRIYDLDVSSGFPEDALTISHVYTTDTSDHEHVRVNDATAAKPCQVITPLNFSGEYFVRSYKKPTNITSTRIEMDVPEKYHFDIIFQAIKGYIEDSEYGESRKLMDFLSPHLPRFWSEQSIRESINNNIGKSYE
jgi:hypothetical protein